MKISLENIGKVRKAEIELRGLTVITGENNSGKTTVGKVLFSLLNVISDHDRKAEIDQKIGMGFLLRDISYGLDEIQHILYRMSLTESPRLFDEHINNIHEFCKKPVSDRSYDEFENLLLSIMEKTKKIIHNFEIDKVDKVDGGLSIGKKFLVDKSRLVDEKAKDFLQRLDSFNINDFVIDRIQKSLNDEFSKQITPVRYHDREGNIILQFDEYEPIAFSVRDDQVEFDRIPSSLFCPYRSVFFIDDPYLIDNLADRLLGNSFSGGYKSVICKHDEHLLRYLKSPMNDNYFSTLLNNKERKDIYEFICKTMPGKRVDKRDGMYYVEKGSELKVSNLATGSKMFFLIKNLLEKGYLNGETVLILDEPEAHLHPEWQNIFAEFIVRLVKFVGVKVLLTTHSPNFMLALETMSLENELGDAMQTYNTEVCDDGYQITYRKVSGDLDVVYSNFVRAMVKMQMIKKKITESVSEDD